jgi:REP element-mobilizing transposase RayT
MPTGLKRFHQSRQSHFVTFSCYRWLAKFADATVYDPFPACLKDMRRRFAMRIYGYVVMPEHVHLLLSEPERGTLAEAMHYVKLSFAKRLRSRTISQDSVQKKDATLGHQATGLRSKLHPRLTFVVLGPALKT